MSSPGATRWLAVPLVVGTLVAYLPALHAGIIWDDRSFIMDNALIHRADGLWRFWFSTKPVDYYPVTSTLWWTEWRLWGANPAGYHVVNVLLHTVNAVLVWRLLARLEVPGAWLAAALFAVHPVNVESVAWIAEGKNVLAMFFYLASLSCFMRSRPFGGSWRWYAGALAAFLLALLSKTVVAPMPLVLLGLIWWKRGRITRADGLAVLPFFVLATGIGLVSFWFQSHRAIGADLVRTDGFAARLAGAGWAIWFYLGKALLPFDLRSIYPRWQIDPRAWWSYLPALFATGVFAVCWRGRRTWGQGPLIAFFIFVAMLSPVLGVMNIAFMNLSLVADRWQYFAVIAPIALGAAAIATRRRRLGSYARGSLSAAAGVVVLALAASTWRHAELYRDSGTFWQAVLAKDPDSWGAHNNLGGFLLERGEPDQARAHFERAVELRPDYAKAQYNLGAILREQGQLEMAVAHLGRAVELQPDYVDAQNSLARALAQRGDWDGAMEHLQRSLAQDPEQAEAHNNLANVLRQKGLLGAAASEYEKAIALHPDYAAAHFNLGEVLRAEGDLYGAIDHYKRALDFRPGFAPALHSLATAYAEAMTRR
ncbi:MAG: tetratricopeptide repeat protein [Pseudomonadota bacterium]